jgi:putative acetyltransferase
MITVEADRLDSPVGATLFRHLLEEIYARYPEELDGAGPGERDEYAPPRGVFLVARLDGEPAGCGALRPLEADIAEVKRMFVEPWARRRGLARRLLAELETAARHLGYRGVRLETGVRQPEAVRLYESAGYVRIPCYGKYAGAPLSICFEKVQ